MPKALVIHPWRETPFKMYKRILEWAIGDGMLNIKYSRLTFRTLPNAVELSLVWIFFDWKSLWTLLFSEVVTETVVQLAVLPIMFGSRHALLCERSYWHCQPIIILAAAARIASDIGRVYGQLTRFEVYYITTRFDWFIGLFPRGISLEYVRSATFYIMLAVLLLVHDVYFASSQK